MTPRPPGEAAAREAGLRRLATSTRDPVTNIELACVTPYDPGKPARKMQALRSLVEGADPPVPPGPHRGRFRAQAIWALIQDEINLLGRPEGERRRTALRAALYLDPTNTQPGIDKRLAFARDRGDFGVRESGQAHGYDALRSWWGRGVRLLADAIDQRIGYLSENPEAWGQYLPDTAGAQRDELRKPTAGAQPFFVDFFLTTIFMKGRSVERRITERIVVAQEDGVDHYVARGFSRGDSLQRVDVPMRALWGCRTEPLSTLDPKRGTKMIFPIPLRRGEKAHFASEMLPGEVMDDHRSWINVDVDHHGIARGACDHAGLLPTHGLTIRIRFDDDCLPDAVWWYAELSDDAMRYERPRDGDKRLLKVIGGTVQKTFTEQPCQPREHYGISFCWPPGS